MPLAPSPLVISEFDEVGGYLVRGTMSVDDARAALAQHLVLEGLDPIAGAREHVKSMRTSAGWYRWNPCHCGGEHHHDIGDGKQGQRGSFPAVEFSLPW